MVSHQIRNHILRQLDANQLCSSAQNLPNLGIITRGQLQHQSPLQARTKIIKRGVQVVRFMRHRKHKPIIAVSTAIDYLVKTGLPMRIPRDRVQVIDRQHIALAESLEFARLALS